MLGTIEAGDIAAIVAMKPDRLIGYAGIDRSTVPKQSRQSTPRHKMGMKGVVIEPGLSSRPMHLDDARMYPIYAHCETSKMPVLFMAAGMPGPDITYTSPEHIDRVARDFPDLKIISGPRQLAVGGANNSCLLPTA